MEMSAIGYVRGADEASLMAQERTVRALAKDRGFDLREVYRGQGESEGPRFREMLAAIHQHPVDAVIVAGLDRITRHRTRLDSFRRRLTDRGIRLETNEGGHDGPR